MRIHDWAVGLVLFNVVAGWGAPRSSLTQYEITWTFDKAYETGQFANGDWWVQGPVTITAMTPPCTSGANGWEVNPANTVKQGFDRQIPNFDTTLIPALPYAAQPGQSVVKAVRHPNPDPHVYLKVAAVLTVVDTVPPDSGTTVFRPAYFGAQKQFYSVNSLDLSPLRSLAPVPAAKDMAWAAAAYQKVQLDHKEDAEPGRALHPADNMPDYGSDIALRSAEAVLALCLNYTDAEKRPAVINYVQAGIDLYWMWQGGRHWSASGGHMNGRKLPIVFAGLLLHDREIMDSVKNAGKGPLPIYDHQFSEDGQIYFSAAASSGNGKVLYGDMKWAEGATSVNMTTWQEKYWAMIYADQGNRLVRDPYGYIDGGLTPGGSYQFCCVSMPDLAAALAVKLVPGLRELWDNETFIVYAERWADFGAWTQPDPCAPPPEFTTGVWDNRVAAGYGVTWGPDPNKAGDCIRDTDPADGIGRFSSKHGINAFDGNYTSNFSKLMWAWYRDSAAVSVKQVRSTKCEVRTVEIINPLAIAVLRGRGNSVRVFTLNGRELKPRQVREAGMYVLQNRTNDTILKVIVTP